MIRGPGNGQEYAVTELIGTVTDEEPTVAYLQDVPMGIAVEWVAAVLIVLFVIASTLLGCLVYSLIWLSLKSRALVRHVMTMAREPQQRSQRRRSLTYLP